MAAALQGLREPPAASLGAFRGVLVSMLLGATSWAALAGFAWLALLWL